MEKFVIVLLMEASHSEDKGTSCSSVVVLDVHGVQKVVLYIVK